MFRTQGSIYRSTQLGRLILKLFFGELLFARSRWWACERFLDLHSPWARLAAYYVATPKSGVPSVGRGMFRSHHLVYLSFFFDVRGCDLFVSALRSVPAERACCIQSTESGARFAGGFGFADYCVTIEDARGPYVFDLNAIGTIVTHIAALC